VGGGWVLTAVGFLGGSLVLAAVNHCWVVYGVRGFAECGSGCG